jgi:hypothetical protein
MIATLRPLCAGLVALSAPSLAGCVDLLGDFRTPGCDTADCAPSPWVRTFGDPAHQSVNGMVVDPFGNTIVTGDFAGTVDFGNGPLQSGGESDVFLVKLDPTGKTLWSKRFGNAGKDVGAAVAITPDGDLLVAGEFSQTVDFGDTPRKSAGGLDIFVAKVSSSGDVVWSAAFGAPDEQIATSVASDAAGNILLTGCIRGTGSFGGTTPWVSLGDFDAYVLALDSQGKYRWHNVMGSTLFDCASHVAADAAGNAIVAGLNAGPMVLDGQALSPYGGGTDVFVAKLGEGDGKSLWAHTFGDALNQSSAGVSVAKNGTIALTGSYEGTVDFHDHTLTAKAQDAFVVFLDASGSTVRSVGIAEPGNQQVLSSALDSAGNVIVTGYSSAVSGQNQIAIAKVNVDGDLAWSQSWATIYDQVASSVVVDPADNVLLGGDFTGTLTLGNSNTQTAGNADAFVAKLGPDSRAP